MSAKRPPIPPAGPPRKGFWGFIASFFPKRPRILSSAEPTEDVPSQGAAGPARRLTENQLPQTDVKAAPNVKGERLSPTVPVPSSLEAPAGRKNEGYPTTLPTGSPANRKPPLKQ